MDKTFDYLEYAVRDGVAQICLNDGGMNTMSVQSVQEWVEAIELANRDNSVGALLVTGEGRVFSAGGDMDALFLPKLRGDVPYDDNDPYLGGLALFTVDWVKLVRESKPIVVAFNGAAVGGGITAFLCADVLIASEAASFHFPFAKLGIVAEMCSSKFLPARVGPGRAAEILLSGRTVASQEALEIGLVDYLFPADQLLAEASAIASRIAANPTRILKLMKQLLDENSNEGDSDAVWRRESSAMAECFAMEEHKRAVEQFLASRRGGR